MLDNLSIEELEKELKRRKEEERKNKIPKLLETLDPNHEFIKLCVKYINDIAKNGNKEDDDTDHYIYEEALKYLFGDNVFDWINKQ